jgi:hypothetical protein
MSRRFRNLLKVLVPPGILVLGNRILRLGVYYSGNYSNWQAASQRATGYNAEQILERVKQAMLKVKGGAAVYERD